jgi:hypothetical protein
MVRLLTHIMSCFASVNRKCETLATQDVCTGLAVGAGMDSHLLSPTSMSDTQNPRTPRVELIKWPCPPPNTQSRCPLQRTPNYQEAFPDFLLGTSRLSCM